MRIRRLPSGYRSPGYRFPTGSVRLCRQGTARYPKVDQKPACSPYSIRLIRRRYCACQRLDHERRHQDVGAGDGPQGTAPRTRAAFRDVAWERDMPAPAMPPTTIAVRVGNGGRCWGALVLNASADATAASSAERRTTLLFCVVHTTGALGSPRAPLDRPSLSRRSQGHHACHECDRSGYETQFTHYRSFRNRHRRLPLSVWKE